jgi:peptidoglycan L-alanyl-D-glutamate endopeptidase CwlK
MPYTLSQKSLDKLVGVHPDLVRVVKRAITLSSVDFRVNEGLRTVERQKQLVAAGASKTMKSRHITGHAVDLVAVMDLNSDGKVTTEEMFAWPLYPKIASAVKEAARLENVPIEWGGDWVKFRDGVHFQLPWKAYP